MASFETPIKKSQFLADVWIFNPLDLDINNKNFNITERTFKALIDTGSQGTCINSDIAKKLKLAPTGKSELMSASDIIETNLYKILFSIPITEKTVYGNKINTNLAVLNPLSLEVREFKKFASSFDVLMGMDVISQCHLFFSKGKLTFIL